MKIKNQIFMRKGIWNGFEYSEKEIKKAFKKIPTHLPIYKEFDLEILIGYSDNFKCKKGIIYCDINLFDLVILSKVGLSPRLIGDEKNNKFINFIFDGAGLVKKPSDKKTYLKDL